MSEYFKLLKAFTLSKNCFYSR